MSRDRSVLRSSATIFAAASLAACTLWLEPDRSARAPRLDGFGTLAMPITAVQPDARDLFQRGMLQTYAFNDEEAARAFKAALALEPTCAMCAWGVAHALGPNINAPDRGDLSEARRYIRYAQRHAGAITPRERALIDAMAARYGNADTPAAAAAAAPICSNAKVQAPPHPLDVVYAEKMDAIALAYPDDADVVTLSAEARMIATRAEWWDRKTGAPARGIAEMTARIEHALAKASEHTGLNHYLIHALDQSPTPQRAAVAADRLGRLAPASPHLLHMPAHIYIRLGRYADAVAVNNAGLAAEVRQAKGLEAQGFKPSGNWDFHNLHFLWFAALMDGRGEGALEQARRLAVMTAAGKSPTAEFVRGLPLLTLVRLERWNAALDEPLPAGENGVAIVLGHYARGVAMARLERPGEAQAERSALRRALAAEVLGGKTLMGDDPARDVLGILAARLDAELAAAPAEIDAARAGLDGAIAQEGALDAIEPPILGAASRLALGDLLLRTRRWPEAEAAYRADLASQPGNGWALRGLQRALAGQAKAIEAQQVERELARVWASADAGLARHGGF